MRYHSAVGIRPLLATADAEHALTEIALSLGVTRDVDSLATLVVARLVGLLGADRALFALLDHAGDVEQVVTHGFDAWPGLPAPLPIAQSVMAECISTRALVVESTHDALPVSARISARNLDLRFLFAMPVEVQGQVVGVLYADSHQSAVRELADVEGTLVALARLVATAVDNARLWEEAEFRNLLLGQVGHDLRMPLQAILLHAHHLEEQPTPGEEVAEIAVDISLLGMRMAEIIATTLELCRPGGARESRAPPRPLDLRAFLEQHLQEFDVMRRAYQLAVTLTTPADLPPVQTLPARLHSVLSNLMFNAAAHAPPDSTIRVTVELRADPGPPMRRPGSGVRGVYLFRRAANLRAAPGTEWVAVSVHNDGRPIPEEAQASLFLPWTRGPQADAPRPAELVASAGLGLAIVEQSLRSLGGRVWLTSAAGVGTTVTFTLPVSAETI